MNAARLSLLFRVDAAANALLAVGALALLAAPHLLALPRPFLVVASGAAALNAADLARTGRQRPPVVRDVRRAAAVDIAFGAALLVIAAAGLPGQSDAVRWTLAALGDVSLVVAIAKLWGARTTRPSTA